ncbi:predicted protein [Histoplasma capsulatum G186AR]|uniref:Integral membrane protein n=1 Tax=Ajellomyces capsulatus (strain G186AR / H82 / ATCC MYA-2454 / RMSCC 2432) TaxID=447093 RepID=C0NTG2_AJECG|nr:uncharacterized protein HCBG_06442 [Histoplasma capsulatum G186AR]EEH05323.1 predicted protein [Histoplasma capsulatum G186AR]
MSPSGVWIIIVVVLTRTWFDESLFPRHIASASSISTGYRDPTVLKIHLSREDSLNKDITPLASNGHGTANGGSNRAPTWWRHPQLSRAFRESHYSWVRSLLWAAAVLAPVLLLKTSRHISDVVFRIFSQVILRATLKLISGAKQLNHSRVSSTDLVGWNGGGYAHASFEISRADTKL